MSVISKETKELIGEHEALIAYMRFLEKSAAKLSEQPVPAKEKVWNYCCNLYDFKDAIWKHLEVDEKVFKAILGDNYSENNADEHHEIRNLIEQMISLADNSVVSGLEQEQLNDYCSKLGSAFDKICKLVELHIAKENAILERVQDTLNNR
jgi:hemerythrin-like domain-containing protein